MKKFVLPILFLFFFSLGVVAQSYTKGAVVEINWGGSWYKGSIKEVKGDQYKITYEGYSAEWDEWVKTDRLRLPAKPAAVSTSSTTKATTPTASGTTKKVSKAPANVPMGEYAVYQWNGNGFYYQHRFTLKANGQYHQFDNDKGTYTYNTATKVLQFKSGPLKGFIGLYYTSGPNNDRGEPVIALDFHGKVPELNKGGLAAYQYAYYRPEGVK